MRRREIERLMKLGQRNPLQKLLDRIRGRESFDDAFERFREPDIFGFRSSDRRDIPHFSDALSQFIDEQNQMRQRLQRERFLNELLSPLRRPEPVRLPLGRAGLDTELFRLRRAQALRQSLATPALGLRGSSGGMIF